MVEILQRRPVSAKHKMVAVVDAAVQRRLEIGPAAPAAMAGAFIKADVPARADQVDRRRQSSQPAADDVGASRHQKTP